MKCRKIILVRSVLIFCLGLIASQVIFATNRPQDSITITTLFVHSWLPELGKPAVASGSVDDSLFAIAGLVLDGDYNSAEKQLNDLEQRSSVDRTKVLILLWRRQLEERRYRFLSGGTQIFGAPTIDAINIELNEKDRHQQLQASIRRLSPDGINDSRVAEQYGLFFSTLNNLPAQIRSTRLFAEVKETGSDDSALRQQEQMALKAIDDNVRVAVQLGLLGEKENQLAMFILMAQLAAARGDFDSARSQLKAGLALASQAGLRKSAAEFMLRLGDVEAIPFGNALTFGYSCLSESQARVMLRSNLTPSVRRVPSATALANAELWYKQADDAFNDLQPASRYKVKIRWAHLARMRGDSIAAAQLYQEAAEMGRRQKAWTVAAVADASAALLLGARTVFFNSLKSLQDRGDRGAMISVAEVAHSWGATNRYLLQNYPRAITTFRMLADALVDSRLDREAVDALFDLASLQGATGRSEMSITTLQEAASAQRRYLTEAETKEKQYQAQIGLMPDRVGLAHERNLLGFLLTQLLIELETKVITEDPKNWVPQRDRVRDELGALNSVSSSIVSESKIKEAFKIQYEVNKAFQDKKCEDALPVFNDARPRAAKFNQPLLPLYLDAAASKCDPKLIGQLEAEMRALNPLAEIRKAQESAVPLPSFKSQLNLQQAVGNFKLLAGLAASVGLYDLLTTWMDQLDEMIRNNSRLQGLKAMSQGFRAVSLLGQNHALEARAILNKLSSDEQLWASFDQDFRIATLSLLVETESVLGNAESALLALERLRFELEQQQELRSGVRPALRMSAEQARLEREISLAGSITTQQSSTLRRLRDESAQLTNESKPPLQLSDLKAALAAIPPNTTVLIYHIGPQTITRWQARRDQPLKMVRLSTPVKDTIQVITKLQTTLANRYPWSKVESLDLYQRLFAKTDPIKNGDVIAVVATGILSRLPFEILGPSENEVLMKDHPIVYLDRLLGVAIKNNPLPTEGEGVLVAGLNSNGLTEAVSEAKDVAALLHADPLLGPDVTNEKIMDKLKSARWVHLATHADIDSTNPYASYLVLAADQRMEAWELFRYAPQAELIVLSACKTKAGIQPLVGPATVVINSNSLASFALAGGAKWIIASLWNADDRASAALMREFYSYLVKEHLDPPHALQKAKQNAANRPDAQPFKYAQFLLSARNISSLN